MREDLEIINYTVTVSTQPFALAYHIIHTINNQCLYSINTGGILLTILHLLFSWVMNYMHIKETYSTVEVAVKFAQ